MLPVTARLKDLRKSAVPPLSVRRIAEELDMPFGSYARFESASTYKKPHLPLDFARKVARVLAGYGVDPAEVMLLAGLTESEAEPEARLVDAARPKLQWISLPVALPSEAALTAMFETLLGLIPPDATRSEAARMLAQQLPAGFSAIGPVVIEEDSAEEPSLDAFLPTGATAGLGRRRPSRS